MPAPPPAASQSLSIIVPLAAGDALWRRLLPLPGQLAADEVIVAAAEAPPPDWQEHAAGARWLHCRGRGRAAQMNEAAAQAKNPYLWFVHADTRLTAAATAALRGALQENALLYFALRFYDGGHKMRVNEFGVKWRCWLFGNPFGDQALCLSARLFARLGGYDEGAPYGEDHLLALRARRLGARAVPLPAAVQTSARRYAQHGWWRTVLLYQRLWWRQWRQA